MIGDRVSERLQSLGMSQSELARRVSLTQGTIAGLINGKARSSSHLHKIARVLQTTPAYLEGETDDPDKNAPPPALPLPVQYVTMQVVLPNEAALAAMYEAQLRVYPDLHGAELARVLAKRLPTGLARLRGVQLSQATAADDARSEDELRQPEDRHESRRAQRK